MHRRGPLSKRWVEDVKRLVKMQKILTSTDVVVKVWAQFSIVLLTISLSDLTSPE